MAKQAATVRGVLGADGAAVPVTQIICFVAAEWSLLARPLRFGDVHVLWPGALGSCCGPKERSGPQVGAIERRLALALPAA